MVKYLLVSGGVVSGLGKGVTASSIGVILKHCGHRVTSIKIGAQPPRSCATGAGARADGLCAADPYLNTDAGTMSPFEHGEVFVLDDGGEVRAPAPVRAAAAAAVRAARAPRRPAQVDLDLGNYERFLDVTLTRDNNLTTGKVYQVPAARPPLPLAARPPPELRGAGRLRGRA